MAIPTVESELVASPAPLRVAVVGAGYWGPNLARNFKSGPDWELAAIVDMDRVRAARLAAAHGDVAVCGSVEELLDTIDVDAVAIATPAHTHHGIALTALRAGKHVLVEKPLADGRPSAVTGNEFQLEGKR